MNFDPENFSFSKWGGGAAALAGIAYYLRKMYRSDKQETSATTVSVTLDKAINFTIQQMEGRLTALVKEVEDLRQQVKNYFQLHQDCEAQSRAQQLRIENLSIENEVLRRNQKVVK